MAGLQINFHKLKHNLDRFIKDEHGSTATEYAVIAVGLSIVILVAVIALGETLNDDYFTPVSDGMSEN